MNHKKPKDKHWQDEVNEALKEDITLDDAVVEENVSANDEMNPKDAASSTVTEEDIDSSDDAIDVEVLETFNESNEIAIALVKAEAALKEANERYQRTMAEFDNFRKRTLKEKASMFENGAKEVLEKLLPVVDNFERALTHVKEEEKELAITQGVEKIYKQMMAAFNELGVEEIDAHHKEFDPNFHHAVSHEENDAYDDNLVQEVYQKGYLYKESVLRHSMVKVVN